MDVTAAVALSERASDIEVRRDLPAADWDRFVERRPDATIYHRAAWADVIRRSFGHETQYLAAVCGEDVVGILPLVFFKTPLFGRFVTSMPFVNYGGIVADSTAAADQLLQSATASARSSGAAYLELRHTSRLFPHLAVKTHKVEMVLRLRATVDEQWQALDRKLRNQVRKAEKSGLEVRTGGVELLDAFYDVLARNMRDLGSPVHSRRFYEHILTTFPGQSSLFCVSKGTTPVAASLVLWHGSAIEVPWASAIRAYNPLCPNVLLYWAMLKFAVEHRFARFDFGRSTPHEGTFQFKQQWGAEPEPLYWEYWLSDGYRLPDRSPKNPKFSAAIAAWRCLPVAVTRLVGPHIVRSIP